MGDEENEKNLGPLAQAIEAERERKVPAGLGATKIQKVEIVCSSNADPSRVARILYRKVVDLSRPAPWWKRAWRAVVRVWKRIANKED